MTQNAATEIQLEKKVQLKISASQDFMKILKERVAETIGSQKQRATPGVYLRILTVLSWFFASYFGLFVFKNTILEILLCISLGLSIAAIGFNLFHDSVHGALSYRPGVNRVWAFLACAVIGPSRYIWKYKHNYLHHQFPNIQNWDDDLETRGALRLSPTQPWSRRYRFQHIYAPLIYAQTSIEWLFIRDFVRYFTSKMNSTQRIPKMKPSDHVEFWVTKLIYVTLTVAVPLCFFSLSQFLVGFLIVHSVASIVLAIVFQLAHVMNDSQFPVPELTSGKISLNWAQLQLATTVNFAPSNKLLSWYCGGLNFQVEHHLFPGLSHAHYRKISPVVQATAEEFGYSYHSLPSHWQALRDHFGMLKKFSVEGVA